MYVIEDKFTVDAALAESAAMAAASTRSPPLNFAPDGVGRASPATRRRFRHASHRCHGADVDRQLRRHDRRTRRSPIPSTTRTWRPTAIPGTRIYRTEFSELGVGVMFDIELFERDQSAGRRPLSTVGSRERRPCRRLQRERPAHRPTPALYRPRMSSRKRWDSGTSWSASLSQRCLGNDLAVRDSGALQHRARRQQQRADERRRSMRATSARRNSPRVGVKTSCSTTSCSSPSRLTSRARDDVDADDAATRSSRVRDGDADARLGTAN